MPLPSLRVTLAALFASTAALAAFGFGHQGHEAIWILAQDRLHTENPAAAATVKAMLGDDDVATAADWADWIRLYRGDPNSSVQRSEVNEVEHSVQFAGSDDWHFVDLPLNTKKYEPDGPFSAANDVVHGINACVSLLEKPDPSPGHLVHHRALRFLIHLVGDLHQPLHVACGYYRQTSTGAVKLVRDPAAAQKEHLPDDRGGNNLLIGSSKLHELWDSDLVFRLARGQTAAAGDDGKGVSGNSVAKVLAPDMKQPALWTTPGDYHAWAAKWATDTITVAHSAYAGLKMAPSTSVTAPPHKGEIPLTQLASFNKQKYLDKHLPEEKRQLLKAAGRLADLLAAIHYAK